MLQTRVMGRAATLSLLVAACACAGSRSAPPAPDLRPGDLLIVDADAGEEVAANAPDGAARSVERRGLLFRAARAGDAGDAGDGYLRPEPLASDERWLEPVDALVLPDRSILVLEQRWAPDGEAAARGAIFVVGPPPADGSARPVRLWWTDERLRQPVALVRAPDGTVYVSDRAADPLGLQQDTGCIFAIRTRRGGSAEAGEPEPATVAGAGPELVTPGALLLRAGDGHLLVMDADSNPRHVVLSDGRPGTPGVLFELRDGALVALLQPGETTSPVGLIERQPGEIYLVDANAGDAPGVVGDGAIFRVEAGGLVRVLDSLTLHRPRALVDPVGGDTLPDGRLVLADANADPLGLGEDGTGKGVYGTGRGAIVAVDPAAGTLVTLLADERFVTPLAVRRVRP